MATSAKFAGTVTQTSGGKYCTFTNLNNIRNSTSGSWAVSNVLIQGKAETPNRPSTITGTNFGFNLPVGAEPTKVIVQYRHEKVEGSDWTSKNKHIMNIPAPTISLVGVSGFSGKGSAPTTTMETKTKTFNVKGKLTRAQVNSTGFGFKLNYPTNTNAYNGYLRVSYVQIKVEYTVSAYNVSVKKTSGGYNEEPYTIQLSITNKNMTNYNPSLTLSSPVGFSYESSKGTGVITQNSARSFTWNPKLSNKVGTSSISLVFTPDVTYPSGQSTYTGTFTLSESLNGKTANHTATITERPVPGPDEQAVGDEVLDVTSKDNLRYTHITVLEELDFHLTLTEEEYNQIFDGIDDNLYFRGTGFEHEVNNTWHDINNTGLSPVAFDDDYGATVHIRATDVAVTSLTLYYKYYDFDESDWVYVDVASFWFDVKPEEDDLTVADYSLLQLAGEELDRLGNGYTYIAEAYLKVDTAETRVRDWYKNNRIIVFNNAISDNVTVTETTDPETGEVTETVTDSTDYDNLTLEEIFENADYIGETVTTLNEYNNIECEFTYNKDYPLYILICGDYPEVETYGFSINDVVFTEPCIIEKNVYREREPNGNYPSPIKGLLDNEDTSETIIPVLDSTTPVILYDQLLDDGYGTNDTMSIRGIQVTGDIEQSDELVITGKLKSPQGAIGERTVIVNDQDIDPDGNTTFTLGGLGDLWGFSTFDLVDLEDWELEITISNLLLEDEANINLGNISIIYYVETIMQQLINVQIQGEDLSYYGCFIEEANVPEGLETDTAFLTIDGTDTNDAYRQNIREKEIELVFTIGECDLGTSTDMLRQVTKLLVNDKDTLNRPIPKRLTLSHYPDVYFEYIMKEAMDITSEAGEYSVKAKLTIPSGTSFDKETTLTNITGNVQGLAAINPVITFKPQSSVIEITELNTSQRFSMGYGGDWQTGIVELDCANRIAYLKTNEDDTQPVDISKYVDFNSDWFSLHGEYSFQATNCVIRTVEYTERW